MWKIHVTLVLIIELYITNNSLYPYFMKHFQFDWQYEQSWNCFENIVAWSEQMQKALSILNLSINHKLPLKSTEYLKFKVFIFKYPYLINPSIQTLMRNWKIGFHVSYGFHQNVSLFFVQPISPFLFWIHTTERIIRYVRNLK